MYIRYPRWVIAFFLIFAGIGVFAAVNRLQFSFNFEDFFPTGDPDLEFYNTFKEKFEPDDNFLLVAIHRKEGIFEQKFLKDVQSFTFKARDIEYPLSKISGSRWEIGQSLFADTLDNGSVNYRVKPVMSAQSLLQVEYPLKTPFSFTTIPAVHLDQPEKYEADKKRILKDERLVNSFVSEDAKTLVVILKTIDNIQQEPAEKFIAALHDTLDQFTFDEVHLLGRSNFQTELVKMQIYEFGLSTVVSLILVTIIMWLIFRRFWGVVISLSSIALGLLIFIGVLGILGRELDTMALLYPVIMIIVGTSDVIHVMSKYVDELMKGNDKMEAIKTTIKEIGMSVFLTSFTTSIGFLSLMASRLEPIRNFGLNAAIGVMLAYGTVIIFTTAVLTLFRKEQIIKIRENANNRNYWHLVFDWIHVFTRKRPWRVVFIISALSAIGFLGLSRINTNTQIEKVLPIGAKVTEDFYFFEENFSGFRPFEVAVMAQNEHTIDDYEVIKAMAKVEAYLNEFPAIRSTSSITWLYKSLNQAFHGNRSAYFKMPESEKEFDKYQQLAMQKGGNKNNMGMLVSEDKKFARISSRLLDVGADSIKVMKKQIQNFIATEVDSNLVQFRQTGTGVIVDKNSVYVRDSLLQGLGIAIFVISILMALLYRNLRMILVALVPNILPLIVAGAILGFLGIPLEAGTAIVFAIIFGIAVDDTIHILGRFRLMKNKGMSTDESIKHTLRETGKAVSLTSVILFFGFMILLFSSNPPAVTIGLLISSTLFSALVCDVFIIPVMLRATIK